MRCEIRSAGLVFADLGDDVMPVSWPPRMTLSSPTAEQMRAAGQMLWTDLPPVMTCPAGLMIACVQFYGNAPPIAMHADSSPCNHR